ncbi:MAG TPA: O-antigen ligase family protein [Thermoleophilaceae bacterium]|nr:O-antigen ligase family protein [Thermoleophilaceae bacterium]
MSVSSPAAPVRAPQAGAAGTAHEAGPARSPAALCAALLVAVLYAATASGATALPAEARLQVVIAALAVAALAGLVFGRSLRAAAAPMAWAGLGLLAAYAAFAGLSLAWSVAPDLTWTHLNRALAYTLVAAMALVVGSSLPRAIERVALGYLAVATLVAGYALLGKVAPWLANHTADFARLRAPLGYWNALALFCVLAVPVGLRTASDPERGLLPRVAAQLSLIPLLAVIGMTYSRGGMLALAVAVAIVAWLGPDRLRVAAFALVAVVSVAPALVVAFTRDDLTRDGLSIAGRTDDGFVLLLALIAGAVIAVWAAVRLRRADERLVLTGRGRELALQGARYAGIAAVVLLLGGLALSERGVTGTVSHEIDKFTEAKAEKQNDPSRLFETNSGNRWVWWLEAGGAWSDRPFGGHGAGSFPLLHLAYRQDALQVRQAHSVPIQWLAEVGLIGAALGLGALGLLGFAAYQRVAAAARAERPYAVALFAAAGAWGVHMWVDWDWDIPAVTLPLLVFLGVMAGRPPGGGWMEPLRPAPPVVGAPRSGRAFALAAGTLVLCVVALSAALPSLARDRTSAALAEASDGTPEGLAAGARDAEIARQLDPLSVEPLFAAAGIAEARGDLDRAADLLREAAERQPANEQVWIRIAAFELQRDDLPRALEAGRQVLRLDPQNEFPLVFLEHGDPAAASATVTGTPLVSGG